MGWDTPRKNKKSYNQHACSRTYLYKFLKHLHLEKMHLQWGHPTESSLFHVRSWVSLKRQKFDLYQVEQTKINYFARIILVPKLTGYMHLLTQCWQHHLYIYRWKHNRYWIEYFIIFQSFQHETTIVQSKNQCILKSWTREDWFRTIMKVHSLKDSSSLQWKQSKNSVSYSSFTNVGVRANMDGSAFAWRTVTLFTWL